MFFFFVDGLNNVANSITFAERLRAAREKAGYSGKELAAALGIKYNSYMSYENQGKEPRQETLVKIAQLLHISTDELLGVSFRQEADPDDIEKPLTHLQEILRRPTANYRGRCFLSKASRPELLARLQEFARRAEVLTEFYELDENGKPIVGQEKPPAALTARQRASKK